MKKKESKWEEKKKFITLIKILKSPCIMREMDPGKELLDFINRNRTLTFSLGYFCLAFFIHYIWSDALFPLVTIFNLASSFLFKLEQPPFLSTVILLNLVMSTMIVVNYQPSLILYFIQIYATLDLMKDRQGV